MVKVLVVADCAAFLDAAVEVIKATESFVRAGTASSGEEAVEMAVAILPDLVLMDVRMPGIGGHEAVRRIRAAQADITAALIGRSLVGRGELGSLGEAPS